MKMTEYERRLVKGAPIAMVSNSLFVDIGSKIHGGYYESAVQEVW